MRALAPRRCRRGRRFDLIVGDLSFISLTLVLPALAAAGWARGELLMLVKPQFELQPADIGKGGLVRDERVLRRASSSACAPPAPAAACR